MSKTAKVCRFLLGMSEYQLMKEAEFFHWLSPVEYQLMTEAEFFHWLSPNADMKTSFTSRTIDAYPTQYLLYYVPPFLVFYFRQFYITPPYFVIVLTHCN